MRSYTNRHVRSYADTQWLRRRQVRDAARLAARALAAARGRDIELPGQHVAR